MTKEIKAYFAVCEYCNQSFLSKNRKEVEEWVIDHQSRNGNECDYNPNNKRCGSCENYMTGQGRCNSKDNDNYSGIAVTNGTCKYWKCRDVLERYIK